MIHLIITDAEADEVVAEFDDYPVVPKPSDVLAIPKHRISDWDARRLGYPSRYAGGERLVTVSNLFPPMYFMGDSSVIVWVHPFAGNPKVYGVTGED